MSRSTHAPIITVQVPTKSSSDFPPFIGVIHRHFQKALPSTSDAREVTLTAPLDMLGFMIPEHVLNRMESLEIVYHRKG